MKSGLHGDTSHADCGLNMMAVEWTGIISRMARAHCCMESHGACWYLFSALKVPPVSAERVTVAR